MSTSSRKRNSLILVTLCELVSCTKENHNQFFYKSFDLFAMRGIDRLYEKPTSGPYVAMEEKGDTILLYNFFPKCKQQKQTWVHNSKYWHSEQIKNENENMNSKLKTEYVSFKIDKFSLGDTILIYTETIDNENNTHESDRLDIITRKQTIIFQTRKKLAHKPNIHRNMALKIKQGCYMTLNTRISGDLIVENKIRYCGNSIVDSAKASYFLGNTPVYFFYEEPDCIEQNLDL